MSSEDNNKYIISSLDDEDPTTVSDFTQLRQDWEPEDDDEIIKRDYRAIYKYIHEINRIVGDICNIKSEQLADYRIKNNEDDKIKENDLKYIYNHEIVFLTYQFMRLSKYW